MTFFSQFFLLKLHFQIIIYIIREISVLKIISCCSDEPSIIIQQTQAVLDGPQLLTKAPKKGEEYQNEMKTVNCCYDGVEILIKCGVLKRVMEL